MGGSGSAGVARQSDGSRRRFRPPALRWRRRPRSGLWPRSARCSSTSRRSTPGCGGSIAQPLSPTPCGPDACACAPPVLGVLAALATGVRTARSRRPRRRRPADRRGQALARRADVCDQSRRRRPADRRRAGRSLRRLRRCADRRADRRRVARTRPPQRPLSVVAAGAARAAAGDRRSGTRGIATRCGLRARRSRIWCSRPPVACGCRPLRSKTTPSSSPRSCSTTSRVSHCPPSAVPPRAARVSFSEALALEPRRPDVLPGGAASWARRG